MYKAQRKIASTKQTVGFKPDTPGFLWPESMS